MNCELPPLFVLFYLTMFPSVGLGWLNRIEGEMQRMLIPDVSDACEEHKKVHEMISVSCRKRYLSCDGAQKRNLLGLGKDENQGK